MKTSVVMATYNGVKYVEKQLESILYQTVPVDEVIICDDVSTDNTLQVVLEFIKKNKLEDKWFVFKNEKNIGYADNFFQGLKIAKGEIIFFADQDDVWHKDKVEKMMKVMKKNADICLLCSDFIPLVSSKDAPKIAKTVLNKMKNDGSLEKISLNRKNVFIGSLGCVMCLRKSFRDKIKPYWFSGWAHDEYVWKLSQCIDGCYIYHEALVDRRLHSQNVSMRKYHELQKRIEFLKKLKRSHEKTYEFGKKNGLSNEKLFLLKKNIKSVKLRIELLKNPKIKDFIRTFWYYKYYHSMKSLLMEPYMAFLKR